MYIDKVSVINIYYEISGHIKDFYNKSSLFNKACIQENAHIEHGQIMTSWTHHVIITLAKNKTYQPLWRFLLWLSPPSPLPKVSNTLSSNTLNFWYFWSLCKLNHTSFTHFCLVAFAIMFITFTYTVSWSGNLFIFIIVHYFLYGDATIYWYILLLNAFRMMTVLDDYD